MSNQCLPIADGSSGECCSPLIREPLTVGRSMDFARMFKALGDPVRLRLLSLVASHEGGEACVCDLQEPLGLSQPTVSHHLRKLREAGLIDCERRGTWVWYRINPARRSAVTALLDAFAPAAIAEAAPEALPDADAADTDAQIAHLAADLAAGSAAARAAAGSAGVVQAVAAERAHQGRSRSHTPPSAMRARWISAGLMSSLLAKAISSGSSLRK